MNARSISFEHPYPRIAEFPKGFQPTRSMSGHLNFSLIHPIDNNLAGSVLAGRKGIGIRKDFAVG